MTMAAAFFSLRCSMSVKRLALPIVLLAAVIATTTACTLFGPSQAERDMAKTIEVYRVLEEHYVDRNNLDVTALNEGAVSGLLEGLGISSEGFDPRIILSTMEIEDMDGPARRLRVARRQLLLPRRRRSRRP